MPPRATLLSTPANLERFRHSMPSPPDKQAQWRRALHDLHAWHTHDDRDRAAEALAFIEPWLRHFMPPTARRRWPKQQKEDALQSFLLRLLDRPLPDAALNAPAAYVRQAFSNHCISIYRKRKRRPEDPWEPAEDVLGDQGASAARNDARAELEPTWRALEALSLPDRVSLKLDAAPSSLTDEELGWLADRTGRPPQDVLQEALRCPDVYALTFLFDPGPEPTGAKERRDRMERFRKRRARARKRMRELLEGDR